MKRGRGSKIACTRSVALDSGGTITVTAAVDLFSLSMRDRELLSELTERLIAYEKASEKAGGGD